VDLSASVSAQDWFVGYLEAKGNVFFFAINLDGASFADIRERRVSLCKQILSDLGYLPIH
jgi:beta-lactamase class D